MEGSYLAIMLSISCSLAFSRHLACTRNMASRLLFCSSSVSPSSPLWTIIIRILQRVDVRSLFVSPTLPFYQFFLSSRSSQALGDLSLAVYFDPVRFDRALFAAERAAFQLIP